MADSAEAALRGAGLRVTRARVAVLDALDEYPHSTVEEIAEHVRSRVGAVSTQAVYDVLAASVDSGLVRRLEPAGSPARFETRTGDNHHHLVCHSCGRVTDVDCTIGNPPCLTPVDDGGYAVDEAEVTFWGLCSLCQQSRSRESGSTN